MASKRPVIAHVLHRLDRAGAEVLAAGLARALQDRFTFVFLCLDGLGPLADELADDGFAVHALGRQPGIDRDLARRLRRKLAEHRVDLVHAHQYTPFFYSALARGVLARKRPRLPILFTEHGRHYPDHRSTKRVFANKLLLRKQDRVTAVGSFVRDALVKNEGLPAKHIDVIYNGIDPGPEPTDADRAKARTLLGIETHRRVTMQVARFHKVKDHVTAIQAWKILQSQQPTPASHLLVLVGDGDERPAIEQRVNEWGLQNSVLFTGAVNNARELIPAADLCMLTSLSEGVSVTLLEAMAAGKPVVATDVGGNPEVVSHEKTGALVPRGDADQLAKAIDLLLPNAEYAQRTYGLTGRQRLLDRFTVDRMHREYVQLYEAVAGDSHG